MKLKHLLFIFMFNFCLLPAMANDIVFNEKYLQELKNEIMTDNLLIEISHNKLKLSNPEDVKIIASDFVDRLYKALLPKNGQLSSKEIEQLIKNLKINIIHLASLEKNNITLLETFINAYHERALTYGAMQTPLDLFLDQVIKGDSFINTLKTIEGDKDLTKLITEIYVNNIDWKYYINLNRENLLKSFIKTNRPVLANFSKMIESTLSKTLTSADREILAKVSILSDMIHVADPEYNLIKEGARYGHIGERATLRADALEKHFGTLTTEDAKFLSKIFENTTPSSLEKMLPEIKEWSNGFLKWNERNLKPKGNALLSVGAMVAIVVVGELINEYTYQPSKYYFNAMDEITDSMETGNYVDLVYKSVYSNKFAQVLDTVFEEDMDEEEQLAYADAFILFNRAIIDVFLKETEEKVNKQIYNCLTYGEDCSEA